jgi:uncharacterized membrane protein
MNAIFLTLRALHVLCAALWLGSVVLLTFFVMPAITQLGPDAGRVMTGLQKVGLNAFMGAIGGLTVLSGFYLYWHFTAGFDPTISSSTGGKLFGAGGVLGLAAVIIGGSIVGRGAKRLTTLGQELATTTDATARTEVVAEMSRLRNQVTTFGNVVVGLLVITTILMALGHYV